MTLSHITEVINEFTPGVSYFRSAIRDQTGRPSLGAANIGPNPTFGEHQRKIEVHVLDFTGDLYGALLTVDFVERLRETRPFPGVTELVEQLRADIAEARRIVENETR